MKRLSFLIIVCIILTTLKLNAQLSVSSSGAVSISNGMYITGNLRPTSTIFQIHPTGLTYPPLKMYKSNGYIGISKGPSDAQYVLDVGGTMRVGTTLYYSDKDLKSEIRDIPSERINDLNSVNAIIYKYDEDALDNGMTENDPAFPKDHFGIIAQDLQKVYPELVYEDSLGVLSIDYIGIIPILLESIKTLNTEVYDLKNKIGGTNKNSSESTTNSITDSYLGKNRPNPFNENTIIEYYLPSTVEKANIYIYDIQGKQLSSYSVVERGKGFVTIYGNELSAGIYYYSLIADGTIIGTERMILTD